MIDTEALRKKIVDLAIQGKLTERLPEDGDAETLYNQIQEEKAKLVKEGKIKKEKPLPKISDDEIPFDIPDNWKWVRVSEIGITLTGATPSKSEKKYYGGDYPFYKPSDLDKGRHISTGSEWLSESGKNVSRQLPQGTILVCCIGSIGKCAIIDKDGTTNQQINTFQPIICDSHYLLYVIEAGYFQNQLMFGSRATTVTIIKKSKFDECVVPLPPYNEQKRIANIIDEIFEFIDKIDILQQQYVSDLEVLKNKIIDAGIRGKLTEQLPEDGTAEELYEKIQEEKAKLIKEGKIKKEKPLADIAKDEIPFEIPRTWKWIRWGELSEKIQYGYNAPAKPDGRIKMVRISDIQDGEVKWDMVPYCDIDDKDIDAYLLRENDILFARTGGTVGKSYIVSSIPEEAIYAGYLIRTSYSSKICARYMKYFMESELYWKQLRKGTIATAQPNCNGKTLSKMIVPFPPYNEQVRIADKIDEMLEVIAVI